MAKMHRLGNTSLDTVVRDDWNLLDIGMSTLHPMSDEPGTMSRKSVVRRRH